MQMNRLAERPLKLSDRHFVQDPHSHFAWMRQNAPVYEAQLSLFKKAFLITRYEDVLAALHDTNQLVKDPNNAKTKSGGSGNFWLPPNFRPLMHNMLNSDAPNHRRLRNLVHKAFTPRMIMQLAPRIEAIAHDLLDKASRKHEIDLIQDFALPLPVTVIADMIGIPKEDHERFRGWTENIVVNPTPLNMLKAIPAVSKMVKYTRQLADKRRVDPQDDLMTALVQAEDEGERFTEDELLGMVFLLVVAGHETTVNLIANGTLALLTHPDQLNLLRSDWSLMETAVEEMLRFDGPLQTTELYFAREEYELHGVTIPQGVAVLPAILSANRDESVFENPNHLDITRKPNKHLAFGQGIHYCLGAPLARLEGKIAFCALLERHPNLRLAVDKDALTYEPIMLLHRLRNLPVSLN
ncbi:MAG: cytochrome P450 [Chloroflexota bacterium]